VLLIAAFYGLYTMVRDLRGDQPVSVEQAFHNARRLIHVERILGIFHEADLQKTFLPYTWVIKGSDDFYGTIHFVAAIGMLLVLFLWFPQRYRLWRNTLAFATGLALIGFYFFPLMPPRLLPPGYHFVDTLKAVGGLWSFQSGPVSDLSNQYAAMPSLHTTWSAWCALVLWDIVRPWWAKALALLYPAVTIFAIVVTANHYFGDVIAGLALLGISYLLSRTFTTYMDRAYVKRVRLAAGVNGAGVDGAGVDGAGVDAIEKSGVSTREDGGLPAREPANQSSGRTGAGLADDRAP
jgi:membrane-associated phospholipid phosphatase